MIGEDRGETELIGLLHVLEPHPEVRRRVTGQNRVAAHGIGVAWKRELDLPTWAIAQVRPWGVDVSSGVEERDAEGRARRGLKDAARIAAFMQGVRNADGGSTERV